MVPFISEHVWQELVRPVDLTATKSVHLSDFPVANPSDIDTVLSGQVALTRRIVELGRAARAESGIKIRQPLSRALIAASGWASLPSDMREQIADELNVADLADIANADGDLVDISVKANFRSLGAKFGGEVQAIAKAIATTDATALVKTLRSSGSAQVGTWSIELDDLVITEVPRTGWMVASHEGESVALDLELTPELIAAGNVREVIRFIQDARKTSGFDISDRITVAWNAPAEIIAAIESAQEHISAEVLATKFTRDASLPVLDGEVGFNAKLLKS